MDSSLGLGTPSEPGVLLRIVDASSSALKLLGWHAAPEENQGYLLVEMDDELRADKLFLV